MTTKELITESIERIKTPDKLVKEFFGEDANGNNVWETDPNACRFCMIGTIRVHGNKSAEYKEVITILNDLIAEEEGTLGITDAGRHQNIRIYNDEHGHADVIRIFKRSLNRCEE